MPRTEAGKRLLEREELNSRSFPLITAEAIDAIEREAAIPDRDALARAIRKAAKKCSSYDWDWVLEPEAIDAIIAALREQE